MKRRLKDKQIEWLLSITTTHNTWLRRRWDGETTITHLLNILSHGEYEIGYEQALLNEIRFFWYREFRKDEVEGLEFLI